MKLRKRLYDNEAKNLGLSLNKKTEGRDKAEYSITEKEWETIQEGRDTLEPKTKSKSKSNNYTNKSKKAKFVLSAWNKKGFMMDIDQYCDHYKLPRKDIRSYKLVSHTGTPYYNIVFKELIHLGESPFDLEEIRDILTNSIAETYIYQNHRPSDNGEGVLKWSDLHFGALIEGLTVTKNFNKDILLDGLLRSVAETNRMNFSKVHVHINGDLIESFSGLNHINSFLSLDPKLIGANAVMLCCDMLEKSFLKIDNLGSIKIVAGNHDRTSSRNDQDVKGGAAELIAWGLKLKGFDIEFDPLVIVHEVDGINHINLHGDKGISKKSTEKILWEYGAKGIYNFIFEGHLHSVIQKLSIAQRNSFKNVKDDSIDHRRMNLPSFFTGNYYSESLGYSSTPGYVVVWNNGKGSPNVFNATL